jgi:HK97 family phage major capsid protein
MSMNLAEARAEIRQLYDEGASLTKKHGGVLTIDVAADDYKRLETIKAELLGLTEKAGALAAAEGDAEMFARGAAEYGTPAERHVQPSVESKRGPRSIGEAVVRSEAYDVSLKSGLLARQQAHLSVPLGAEWNILEAAKAAGLQQKALITSSDTSGGAFIVNDRLSGYTPLVRQALGYLDILPTLTTTSDLVEYIVQDTRTNAAAPVAEATATTGVTGLKPESALAFSLAQKPVEQIATWIPMTTRILNDAPMLRSAVDDELLYMLRETLEVQTLTGSGTSPNLQGVTTLGTIPTAAAGADPIGALFNAAMQVQIQGGVPATAAALTAASWQALRLARENAATGSLGGYIMGPPNMPGPMSVFGLDLALSTAMPANTAIVGNFTPTTIALVQREGGTIETGWINDQFVRNMLTLRAELRAVQVIRRPKGLFKITGMP